LFLNFRNKILNGQAELIGASFASASLWLHIPDRMTSIAHGLSWTLTQGGSRYLRIADKHLQMTTPHRFGLMCCASM